MSLQTNIEQICKELEIPIPVWTKEKFLPLSFGENIEMEIRDLEPGLSIFSKISACPTKKLEDLFLQLMRANYLGQATGSSRIGMSADEKFLTLSLGLPYEMSYRDFREIFEDFVNFLLFWREEIKKMEKEST